MTGGDPLLEVRNLETQFHTEEGPVKAANGVSYTIQRGESYGFVGESGAGKTVTGLSVLGLIENPGRVTGGEVLFNGQDLLAMDPAELRRIRGNEIAMIFQDPMTSLNPAYTIGTQLVDTILEHTDRSREEARERAIKLLDDVGIPDPASRIDDYQHQYSGGMRQRALIAMAVSCEPDLIIADEPTTALDVTTQAQILDLLQEFQAEYNLSIQFITHNMGLIRQMCDRVSVMYAGEVVEEGTVDRVFDSPRHPYTLGLMESIPQIDQPGDRLQGLEGTTPDLADLPSGCSFRTRCPHATDACAADPVSLEPITDESEETLGDGSATDHKSACIRSAEIDFEASGLSGRAVEEESEEAVPARTSGEPIIEAESVRKYFNPESASWVQRLFGNQRHVHAVDDVSLAIREGETMGLVGESGCGKTTLGMVLAQLHKPDSGRVLFTGNDLSEAGRRELRGIRSDLQVIFQNPFSSLNPRKTVKQIIGRPMRIHGIVDSRAEMEERVIELLKDVGLQENHLYRYPHEFSGGQKQRIGIARALAVSPDFVVADEPVSSLDVSVQAKILNLLMDLQEKHSLTYLFIAHDLNVINQIADRVAVMYLGEIVEKGTIDEVFQPPFHPYTEMLLSSIPAADQIAELDRIMPRGEPPSPIDPPSGCRFHPRCPYAMDECAEQAPSTHAEGETLEIDCHLFDETIMAEKDGSRADPPAFVDRTGADEEATNADD